MAGGGASKSSNSQRLKKRVEAETSSSSPASLKRAKDGSAFAKCEECNRDVPVALISFHNCSLDAKIKMNLDTQVVEMPGETKKKRVQDHQCFRPLSKQEQVHQCRQLATGTTVCALYGMDGGDLKFYDAVVEVVDRREHSFSSGEEECLCKFVLFWKHGPGNGQLTSASIDSICTVQPVPRLDPRISAFAKEKITSSKAISVYGSLDSSQRPSSGNRNSCESIDKNEELSQNRVQEVETDMMLKSLTWKDEGRISKDNRWSHDDDMGGKPCIIDASTKPESRYFILIDNLEKDLTPLLIQQFIYEKTNVVAQTLVFPSLLHEPFARGIIMVDCQKKVQIIDKFLNNPKHLIVSLKWRPWVVTQKAMMGNFGTIGNVDDIHDKGYASELQIVHSGTKFYKLAKELRDLFMELKDHESGVCEKFVWEERTIFQSFQAA